MSKPPLLYLIATGGRIPTACCMTPPPFLSPGLVFLHNVQKGKTRGKGMEGGVMRQTVGIRRLL